MEKRAEMEMPYQLRRTGWQVWYYQNFLFLFLAVLLLFNFGAIIIGFYWYGDSLGAILNFFFNVCMILDLIAVGLIVTSLLFELYRERRRNYLDKTVVFTIISGFFWIGFSVAWRLPLYLANAYEVGLGFRLSMRYGQRESSALPPSLDFLTNSSRLYFFLGGSLFLLLFLIGNGKILSATLQKISAHEKAIRTKLGTWYGIANLGISVLFLLLLIWISGASGSPYPYIPFVILIGLLKLFVIPPLGIFTSRKFFSWLGAIETVAQDIQKREVNADNDSDLTGASDLIWRPVRMRPTRRTSRILFVVFLLWVVLPLSPAFIGNLRSSSPAVDGPYITREAPSHGMQALRHVENLSSEDLGSPHPQDAFPATDYVMVNETLEFFLAIISNAASLVDQSRPYSYGLNWSVSVEESEYPEINTSTLQWYWGKNFEPRILTRLMWWEANTRFDLGSEEDRWILNLNETSFRNFSHQVRWVFSGTMRYIEVEGPLAAYLVWVEQLLFLNANMELVCLALAQAHAVA